jgi:hypothetical protein
MGKFFNTNTWRAPLQLIDCWLPMPSEHRPEPTARFTASKTLQRFTRAGWLHREAANGPSLKERPTLTIQPTGSSPACRVRVLRQVEAHRAQALDAHLVIAGPIGEVCAELDRLAALEQASMARAA